MVARALLPFGLLFVFLCILKLEAGEKNASSNHEQLLAAGKAREFPRLDWSNRRILETAHFHLETNVPEDTGRYLQALLEALYAFYGQKLGGVPKNKVNVFIFAQQDDFAAELQSRFMYVLRPGEGGLYFGHTEARKQGLYVPWVATPSGLEPSAVVIHEGFHLFYNAVFNTDGPKWFNEALATYFENAEFDGEKIVDTGKISVSKLRGMQHFFKQGKVEPLRAMMLTSDQKFIGPQYCEAWSFLYWALWSEKEKSKRAAAFQKILGYLAAIRDAKNQTPEAFEQITGITLSAAEPKWKTFVEALNPNDPWGGLEDLGAKQLAIK